MGIRSTKKNHETATARYKTEPKKKKKTGMAQKKIWKTQTGIPELHCYRIRPMASFQAKSKAQSLTRSINLAPPVSNAADRESGFAIATTAPLFHFHGVGTTTTSLLPLPPLALLTRHNHRHTDGDDGGGRGRHSHRLHNVGDDGCRSVPLPPRQSDPLLLFVLSALGLLTGSCPSPRHAL